MTEFERRAVSAAWPAAMPAERHMQRAERVAQELEFALESEGFRLFVRGGVPRLERRSDFAIQEVLVRAAAAPEATAIRLKIYVSVPGLREIREAYWQPAREAPQLVAAADLGHLDIPPGQFVWHVDEMQSGAERMVSTFRSLALPWLAAFQDEAELLDRLDRGDLALIETATIAELMMLLGRKSRVRAFLQKWPGGNVPSPRAITSGLSEPERREQFAHAYGFRRLTGNS
jgi:hypothetical protein